MNMLSVIVRNNVSEQLKNNPELLGKPGGRLSNGEFFRGNIRASVRNSVSE